MPSLQIDSQGLRKTLIAWFRATPRSLWLVVALGLILGSVGIWWGIVPGSPEDWGSDTILPRDVFQAAMSGFSNGWFSRYPPFHYQLLTTLYSPAMALHLLGFLDASDGLTYAVLLYLGRFLSLGMGLILLLLVYSWARSLGLGRHPATFAAAITALNPMFAFYSKTTNLDIPYTMWFVAAMLFATRAFKTSRLRDMTLFALFATLAVTTKDQAYGLFAFVAPLLGCVVFWRARQQTTGVWQALRRASPILLIPVFAALVLSSVIYVLPFNLEGVVAHFRLILGPASADYRIYEGSFLGQVQMLSQSIKQISFAMGWPMLIVCVLGLIRVAPPARSAPLLLLPLVTAVSYYLSFIAIVGYNYDRFFLPILTALSVYGGYVLAETWHHGRIKRWIRRVAVLSVLFYSLFYAGSVDATMLVDGRYEAVRWMDAHVAPDDVVATVGDSYYLPPLFAYRIEQMGRQPSLEKLVRVDPDYVVTSSIFGADIFPTGSEGEVFFAALEGNQGFELAFSHQGEPIFTLLDRQGVFTNLNKINPEIRVFRKVH